jgi:hypothetical protein
MFTENMIVEHQLFLDTTKKTRTNEKSFPQCYIQKSYLPERAWELAIKYHFNLLTEEEIKMIKTVSRFCVNFWVIRGYSEEQSKLKISNIQKINSKKNRDRPVEQRRKENNKCIEYWLDKGYTEEEGRIKISESQSTFSLKICIEKHGVEEGTRIWQDRQDRWQETLNSKPKEEMDEINKRKCSGGIDWALKKCNGNEIEAKQLLVNLYAARCNNNFRYSVSKESLKFLSPIIEYINSTYPDLTIFYGNDGKKEYYIKGDSTIAYYDFTILELQYIIEYNGTSFHPKEGDVFWRSPFGATYDDILNRDKFKKSLAEQHEFELYYVWSDSDLTYETNYIMRIIDEKYRNYITTII